MMIKNPIDCTPITIQLSLQDIRKINNVIYYTKDALRQLVHHYELAARRNESNAITEKCIDAQDIAADFEKASNKLLDAFADGTYKAGISPFDC